MKITVLVESCEDGRVRATCLTLPGFTGEGPTREDALAQLTQKMRERLARAEIVTLDIPLPGEPHPWMALAGSLKDHPDFDEWVQNMQEYRRQVDADSDRP